MNENEKKTTQAQEVDWYEMAEKMAQLYGIRYTADDDLITMVADFVALVVNKLEEGETETE